MPSPRRSVAPLLALGLLAACGSRPEPTTVAPPPSPAASEAPSAATSEAPSVDASDGPGPIGSEPPSLALQTVAEGLADPIGLTGAPGGWLLVNEQAGTVVAIHPERGERAIVVDLRDRIRSGGEQGLLGLVLHPEWPDVGRAFVHYTAVDGNHVLAELAGAQDGDAAPLLDAASERVLLGVPDPYANHNGGQLAFGPDGHLWLGLGDGGSADDPHGHGQDTNTLLGSLLRLDVSEPGVYAIPDDNPFAGGGGAPEIYLWGLRNPWRFSFDPVTGLLWIADVGQNAYEEIDRVDPAAGGANLGWNVMEGAHCFADAGCTSDDLVLPLAEYGRDLGCSITGGHVYRGSGVEGLAGWYLAGDYCTGNVFGVPSDARAPDDGTALRAQVLLETGMRISSFGVDDAGEHYVADHSEGTVSRIVAGAG